MLSFRWCGRRRVVTVTSPAVCVVEDLRTCKKESVHATRWKKYSAFMDGQNVPDEVLDLASRTASRYEIFESIVDLEKNDEGCWLRLQWEGLPDERDFNWSTLQDMHEDIPDMVVTFLLQCRKKTFAATAARQLGILL